MSSIFNTRDGPVVRRVPALLYPTLLIAGIAVIIVSMLGIAAMTGVLPRAQSHTVDERGGDARSGDAKSAQTKNASGKTASAVAACTNCGVVDSVRAVEVKGQGSGLGAVTGGVLGGVLGNQVGGGNGRTAMTVVGAGAGAYAGNEVEKNMKKSVSYQIRVRMDDNTIRTFHSAQPDVGVGQRVKVRDGRLVDAG
jgi:outer membrane lipoprotein SlyB